MIDYDGRNWLDIVTRVRGSVLPRLLPRALFGGALGGVAAWAWEHHELRIAPIAHTMIGVALGLLLVFRTNASYDRYWEGRRLLGNIVIRTRDLVRQAAGWAPGEAHETARRRIRDLSCAYFRAAALTLRGEDDDGTFSALLPQDVRARILASKARPQAVMAELTRAIDVLRKEGALTDTQQLVMDQNLGVMTDALTGCERILRTPVPFAYAQHIKIFVILFCYTAPFTMSDAMGWYTPIAATLLCIALFGVDEIGVEIEDPFGRDANDLPLDAMAALLEKVTAESVSA